MPFSRADRAYLLEQKDVLSELRIVHRNINYYNSRINEYMEGARQIKRASKIVQTISRLERNSTRKSDLKAIIKRYAVHLRYTKNMETYFEKMLRLENREKFSLATVLRNRLIKHKKEILRAEGHKVKAASRAISKEAVSFILKYAVTDLPSDVERYEL